MNPNNYFKRWWRAVLAVLMIGTVLPAAFANGVSREAALGGIATNVIAAAYENLAVKCQLLTNAASQMAQSPDAATLEMARKAWAAVAEAANRVRCFQSGPIVDREYAATFFYARVSPPLIDGDIQSTNTLDQAHVDGLGGDTKGLFALEYLLFGHKGYPGVQTPNAPKILEMLSDKNSGRRRAFLLALACDLESKAGKLAADWKAQGAQAAAEKFATGGQASIGLAVNQLTRATEDVSANHLHLVLALPPPVAPQLYRIEGYPSGTWLTNMLAYLSGAQKLYLGAGGPSLDDIVKQGNAPLAQRIEDGFAAAIAATEAIGESLDQAAQNKRDAVTTACEKTHALELLLKVDLASCLGVTITLTSGDGD